MPPASSTKMLCVVLLQSIFFIGLTSSMFADDYDPDDIPLDQARGYSYPVPPNPLSLPVMEEYDDYDPNDVPADQAAPTGYLPPTEQYDDYDPTDIPADQAAPAPAGYLPAARRGRKLTSRRGKEVPERKHNMMLNTKRAKTGMKQRQPKALRSSVRRFSGRALSLATSEAKRKGRQIMSVSEWLRRG